jgi:hypothetical protein
MNNIIYEKIDLTDWIGNNTSTSKSVVELGAGFFGKLSAVHPNVKLKIGIEIYQPYIDNSTYNDCVKIQGNVIDYKNLLNGYELDTVLIVDVLEHLEKNVGYAWINNLKNDFNKILLMLPVGEFIQDKDLTGYDNHEYQAHRSYWSINDIETLKFQENKIDPTFHSTYERVINKLDTACYFGVWNKNI